MHSADAYSHRVTGIDRAQGLKTGEYGAKLAAWACTGVKLCTPSGCQAKDWRRMGKPAGDDEVAIDLFNHQIGWIEVQI